MAPVDPPEPRRAPIADSGPSAHGGPSEAHTQAVTGAVPPVPGVPPASRAPSDPARSFGWDEAARAHNRKVVVHLLARGLSLDDAQDVAQRTWARLIALDRAGRLTRIEMPGLALAQARFLAATLRRERSGLREASADALDLVVDDGTVDAERAALARDRVQRALAFLESAPPSTLQVFRRVLGDPPPTHATIAKEVGLSEQRVRQIVCETRARLRRALEPAPGSSATRASDGTPADADVEELQ